MNNNPFRQRGRAVAAAAVLGFIAGGAGGWFLAMNQQPRVSGATPAALSQRAPAAPAAAVKYGFEADRPHGWACGDYDQAAACKSVSHTSELRQQGDAALKWQLDLAGGDAHRGSGEIWVDVNAHPPAGGAGPVSLAGRKLTAWIYATPGAAGDKSKPNGAQLFIKDGNWKADYGPWHDLVEGQWTKLSYPVGKATAGFNPAKVNAIGVKIAGGEGSQAAFDGAVYVDAVDW